MNALLFATLASLFTALSSLFFRKNGDVTEGKTNPSGYLMIFYLSAFIATLFIYSDVFLGKVNYVVLAIGACVGFFSSTLMLLTSKALENGPAGLTFAFQNASAVFPGLVLFLFLGSDFGYSCSLVQLLGIIIVLLGLFLGAKREAEKHPQASSKWLKYALGCFAIQILALTFIQARCILFDCQDATGILSNFAASEADDIWFMPGQFGMSFAIQSAMYLKEKRKLYTGEMVYGSLAGIANFLSNTLLLLATKFALPFEKGILFPCFSVGSMILCNLWANRLYKEYFNFKTNVLCSFGIFMAVAG